MSMLQCIMPVLLFFSSPRPVYTPPANAGPDVVNCQGMGVRIGAPPLTDGDWCYKWTASPADPSLKNLTVPQPIVNPVQKTTYTLTVYKKDDNNPQMSQDNVDVYVLKSVIFSQDPAQEYGFDDGIYIGPTEDQRWKSVAVGKADRMVVKIEPEEAAQFIQFKCSNESIARVLQLNTTRVLITGVSEGETIVQAICRTPAQDIIVDEINVVAYNMVRYRIAIRLVHEQNDDIQVIRFDKKKDPALRIPFGKPHTIAITAGADGMLNTIYPSGDDKIIDNLIETGDDGVCQTSALYNDVQRIPVGKGEPYQICITAGANNFRDTKPSKDDEVGGLITEHINTGANGICDTDAQSSDVKSNDFDKATLLEFLNKSFGQAVIQWELFVQPTMTINMDYNLDGDIDLSPGSMELLSIMDNCWVSGFDANLFFINSTVVKAQGVGKVSGYALPASRSAIVDVKEDINPPRTVVHELGHAVFSLKHPKFPMACSQDQDGEQPDHFYEWSNYYDWRNFMEYCGEHLFRKFQWDLIHNK